MKKNICNKFRFTLLAGQLFFISFSFAQQKTGANTETSNGSSSDTLAVWAVPAEQKVLPSDKVESTNIVWSKSNTKINMSGAGNENVPFQVVISSPGPPGRRPKPAAGFFITSSDLKSKSGKIIPKAQINFYLEHYI